MKKYLLIALTLLLSSSISTAEIKSPIEKVSVDCGSLQGSGEIGIKLHYLDTIYIVKVNCTSI